MKQKKNKRLAKSVRKFIRKEKAKIRRELDNEADILKKIEELYKRFIKT